MPSQSTLDTRDASSFLSAPESDLWSDWLLRYRVGEDDAYEAYVRGAVAKYVDRVLDFADLKPGMTLLDVGTGEGVVGLEAVRRACGDLSVIMTDISKPMLTVARENASRLGVSDKCRLVCCPADDLSDIPDESVDAVTTRAVLAYVDNKVRALGEFIRVLKPGGRISIAEPVFRDAALSTVAMRNRTLQPSGNNIDLYFNVMHKWLAGQFPDTLESLNQSPLTNYTERDLFNIAANLGFENLHMEMHIDIKPSPVRSWDVFLKTSPHPWAKPLTQIMDESFTEPEKTFFEAMARPSVESGQRTETDRVVYITGTKPRLSLIRAS